MSFGTALVVGIITMIDICAVFVLTYLAPVDPIGNGIRNGATLLFFALWLYYLLCHWKSSDVPTEKRVLWYVVLTCAVPFSWPFYWYHYMFSPARTKIPRR